MHQSIQLQLQATTCTVPAAWEAQQTLLQCSLFHDAATAQALAGDHQQLKAVEGNLSGDHVALSTFVLP